jgi:hypothetical protein
MFGGCARTDWLMECQSASLPLRGLLDNVKVRDQVSHPLRRDSGRSSNRNLHFSPSVNTSRLVITDPRVPIWITSG